MKSTWTRIVKIVIVVVLAIGVVVSLIYCWTGGLECAECETDTDCAEGLRCVPFTDGQLRCARSAFICRVGHIQPPRWLHGIWVFIGIVVGLYLLRKKRVEDEPPPGQ